MKIPLLSQLNSTRIGRFEAAWYFHSFITELALIYPVFGIMMLESVSNFELSLLFVVWAGVAIPLEIPCGTLADRFDRRHLLAVAGLIEGGCFLLWIFMPGFWGYLLGFMTWAIAGTLQSGTSESLVYDVIRNAAGHNPDALRKARWIESIYTRIYGRSLAAHSMGITLALLLGGYAAARLGYERVLLLSAIAPMFAASALWLLIRDPRKETHRLERRFREVLSTAFSEILPNPQLRHSILAFATIGAAFAALEDFLGPFYQEKAGITLGLIGVIFGIAYLGTTSGLLVAERLTFRRANSIHWLMMLAATMLVGAVFIPGPLGVGTLVVYFFICAVCFVHMQTRMQVRIKSDARATVTSVAWMLDALVGLGFYLIIGAVAEAYSWHASFIIIAGLTALCSLAFVATSPPETTE